jgi:hypothetical protein
MAYSAGFERGVIRRLALALPDLAADLEALRARVVDLLPMVKAHIYAPAFHGSFGLKAVLPALTDASYDGLAIAQGQAASAGLERLLFGKLDEAEASTLRRDLLAYCAQDTWALVALLGKLRELSAGRSRR